MKTKYINGFNVTATEQGARIIFYDNFQYKDSDTPTVTPICAIATELYNLQALHDLIGKTLTIMEEQIKQRNQSPLHRLNGITKN